MKLKSTSRTPLPPRSLAFTLAPGAARVGDAEFNPVGPCSGRGMMLYKIQLGDHDAHHTETPAVSLGIGPGQSGLQPTSLKQRVDDAGIARRQQWGETTVKAVDSVHVGPHRYQPAA